MITARVLTAGALVLVLASSCLAKSKPTPQALRQQAQRVCVNDATQFCNDVITDEAATMACLTDHKDELSPPCLKLFNAITQGAK